MQGATAPFEVVSHSTVVPAHANRTVQCTKSLAAPPLEATMVLCIKPIMSMHRVSARGQASLSDAQGVDLPSGSKPFYRELKLSVTRQI